MSAPLRSQTGMTLIEVLVATLILTIGLIVILTALDASNRATASAGRSEAAAAVGEQELQRIESLEYAQVALSTSTVPIQTSTSEATNPTTYLAGCPTSSTCTEYKWNWLNTSLVSPLVIATTTDTTANPRTVSVAAPKGGSIITLAVYRFITWVGTAAEAAYKRVTVVVKNTGSGPPKTPVIYTALVTNQSGGTSNPLTQSGTACSGETSCTY
jgi:Tfp pilus assembly protein PilV